MGKKGNPLLKEKLTPKRLALALLWNRGIRTAQEVRDFVNPSLPGKITLKEVGIDPGEAKKAVARVKKAIENQEKIVVYGDYDVDGFCSTALVWEALRGAGGSAIPFIPSRENGYGLKAKKIQELKSLDSRVGLVITTDNGIVEHEEIRQLKEKGVEVIITDHHQPQKTFPKAVAIVHTTQLSGSGVAWFFARELKVLGAPLPDLGLAALGTVTDMMEVKGASRSLIKHGLPFLQSTPRAGLRALFSQAGIDEKIFSTYELGFIIGPRLNALGRIADPMDGLRLLCVKEEERGKRLAKKAQEVNRERQKLTQEGLKLARRQFSKKDLPFLLFASSPSFEQGIVGLIASKLKDEFYRPVLVIKKDGKISRGSARSIKELNIVKTLRGFNDLFIDLGGHPLAAGFELKTKDLEKLKKKLLLFSKKKLQGKKLSVRLEIDLPLSLVQATPDYYQAIQRLAPFGLGNKEPLFIFKGLRILDLKTVGSNGGHLKLILDDPATPREERMVVEAIGFYLGGRKEELKNGDLVDVVASVTENVWRGRRKIVLKIKDLRLAV